MNRRITFVQAVRLKAHRRRWPGLSRPQVLLLLPAVLALAVPLLGSSSGRGCPGPGSQAALALLMFSLTCGLHALVSVVQVELSRRGRLDRWCGPRSSGRLLLIVAMALLTALALLLEILLWAVLYSALGFFPTLEGSLYFSGITFTTVGYGDMTLPACGRLLSVAEAVNGVLMAGWSTAQLITVVQRMMELRLRSEGWERGLDSGSLPPPSR